MTEPDPLNRYLLDYEAVVLRTIAGLPIRFLAVEAQYHSTDGWNVHVHLRLDERYPDNEGVDNSFHTITGFARSLAYACDNALAQVATLARHTERLMAEDIEWSLRTVGRRVRHVEAEGDAVVVWEFRDEGCVMLAVPVPVGHEGLIVEHRPGRVRVVFDQEIPGATNELWVHRWKFENHRRAPNGNEVLDSDPFYRVL